MAVAKKRIPNQGEMEQLQLAGGKIRSGFQPAPEYYDFVASHLLNGNSVLKGLDPLDLDLPHIRYDHLYYDRTRVSTILALPRSQIIFGKRGSGKTMLFNNLKADNPDSQLLVRVNLQRLCDFNSARPGNETCTPLSSANLTHLIFNTFWDTFLTKHSRKLTVLRKDRDWMDLLRWFYHKYPPLEHRQMQDFELDCWLEARPKDHLLVEGAHDNILQRLLGLVTQLTQQDNHTDQNSGAFKHVTVLLDQLDMLPSANQNELSNDIAHIFNLRLPNFDMKVFVDHVGLQPLAPNHKPGQRLGDVPLIDLPKWEKQELLEMLRTRLFACTQGGQPDEPLPTNFPVDFFQSPLEPDKFYEQVAESALRCYTPDIIDSFDAPYHFLRLLRGVIAYAGGMLPDLPARKKLDTDQLTCLLDFYWSAHK